MPHKFKPNAIYFFAQEYKAKNNLDMPINQILNMDEVFAQWKKLTDDERAPYQKLLVEWKLRNKNGKPLSIHSDSSISSSTTSSRVSHETKLENRQRHFEYKLRDMFERAKDILLRNTGINNEKLLTEYSVKNKKWHIIDFQTFCRCPGYNYDNHHYEPYYVLAEMGLVEYSLEHGIEKIYNGNNELRERSYHTFIQPNTVPLGFRSFVHDSVSVHGIPFGGLAEASEKTYADIYNDIIQFINDRDDALDNSSPLTVFCLTEDYEKTEFALQFLRDRLQFSHNRQIHPREIQIIGLEYLVKLMAEKSDRNVTIESAKDFLLQSVHSYTKEAACLFHQDKETLNHCSLSKVKRYCYLISEAICRFYGIQLTERHVPKFESNATITKKDNRKYFKSKATGVTPSESFNSSSRGLSSNVESESSSQVGFGEEEETEHDPEEFPDLDSNSSDTSSLSEYFGQTLTTVSTSMGKSISTKVTTTISSNRVLVAEKFQNSLAKSTTTTSSTTRTISSVVSNNSDETSSQISTSTIDENDQENDEKGSPTSTDKDFNNNNNQFGDVLVCGGDHDYNENNANNENNKNDDDDDDVRSNVSDTTISDITSRSSVSMFLNRQAISELSSQVRGRGRLLSRR